jgi:ATP-binding protein involved in chromosome partitioning
VPVLGMVENISYFMCPHWAAATRSFRMNSVRLEAERLGTEFLGGGAA